MVIDQYIGNAVEVNGPRETGVANFRPVAEKENARQGFEFYTCLRA